MTEIDRTELHELRERVQGAAADREIMATQLRDTLTHNRELETQLQQVTQHRDRLLEEKERAWGEILRPDSREVFSLETARLNVLDANGKLAENNPMTRIWAVAGHREWTLREVADAMLAQAHRTTDEGPES